LIAYLLCHIVVKFIDQIDRCLIAKDIKRFFIYFIAVSSIYGGQLRANGLGKIHVGLKAGQFDTNTLDLEKDHRSNLSINQ
jgi:hypothetical protein